MNNNIAASCFDDKLNNSVSYSDTGAWKASLTAQFNAHGSQHIPKTC